METRNIIAAISLSAAVIILSSLFFAPPPVTKENLAEKTEAKGKDNADSKPTRTDESSKPEDAEKASHYHSPHFLFYKKYARFFTCIT